MREVMASIHYLESIVVFVEDEFAASGSFLESAFFNDVLGSEVTSGAYLVFENRYAGAFLIFADYRRYLAVCALGAPAFATAFVLGDYAFAIALPIS